MRKHLSFLFLFYSLSSLAQKPAEHVFINQVGSKFQYINKQTGLPVSQQLWDEADPFVNGFSRVFLKDKFSFVNTEGQLINPVEFEDARNFSNKLAAVKKGEKWGFINESGKIIFPLKYDIIFDFEEAISVAYRDKSWWLISYEGEEIKSLDISVCFGFKNGVAKIIKDDYEGLLYTNGNLILAKSKTHNKPIPYHPNANVTNSVCPSNLDFENGDFTNWECFIGRADSVGNINVITMVPPTPVAPVNGRHTLVPKVLPSLLDPYGLFSTNPPDGSNYAVKLGNNGTGAQAERVRYTIHVPFNDSNFSIKYDYAVVFQDPGHTNWTQPRFTARLLDSATNTYIPCASFEYIATSGLPGFKISTVNSSVIYKEWSSVFFSVMGSSGKTLYLEFTTADCVRTAHWGYAYIDVGSVCGQAVDIQYDCIYPNITVLTGPPGFQSYKWWNHDFSILVGTGQTLTLNPGPVYNTVMWVEITPFQDFGCHDTLKVLVTGTLHEPFGLSDTIGCVPKTITFYNRNLPSTASIWDFGDGSFGTGDTVTHTYALPGTYTVQLNSSIPSGCSGTFTHPVVINPIPDVIQPPDQMVCNGATTNTIGFAGAVAGTTFSWANSDPSIGLAASGVGDIGAFTVINTGSTPVTATITVTPSAAGCIGPPQAFTITVNPTPTVVQPANLALCNGATTNSITFAGSITGTTFTWTNTHTSIGLPAWGIGNIPAFTATNTGIDPVIATITITPSLAGCDGPPQAFTITVYPTPTVVQPPGQTLCSGTATNAIAFAGTIIGTTYNWVNSDPSIGLAAAGSGNIPAFTATNPGTVPVTATITVTPLAFGCTGTSQTFTITVNPVPTVALPVNQALCNGSTTSAITFAGSITGTVFTWTNTNPSIGLAGWGIGNIPAFTATNTGVDPVIATITVTPSAWGCDGTPQAFTITVYPTPTVVQPLGQVFCSGTATNAIVFTGAIIGTTYNWVNSNPSIGLAAAGSGNIPAFVATNPGTVPVIATITVAPLAFGCAGIPRTFPITVNPTPNVLQPANQGLCNGAATAAITFTGALSGTVFNWVNDNPAIGLPASGAGNIPAFTAINAGNIPVTATISVTPSTSLCAGQPVSVRITVHPTPLVSTGGDKNVCLGQPVQLVANGAATYTWSPATNLSCTTCPNPVATLVDTMRYIVNGISTAGCQAADTIFVNIIKPFQMLVSPNDSLCMGESSNLIAGGADSYLWLPPQGLNRNDIANPVASPSVTTQYRVVGYDAHNCFTDTGFVNIVVGPIPVLDLGPDLNLSTGTILQLNPVIQNGPIINWVWTPATGLSCNNCPAPVTTATNNSNYRLTVTNNHGCVMSDDISIFVFCKTAQVFIPNSFTPDGDGLNDILMVRGKGVVVRSFRIFNRWGELVFEKSNFNPNDIKFGWDGKVGGIAATPDVFVYTAEVICDNNVAYTYKGNTSLLK